MRKKILKLRVGNTSNKGDMMMLLAVLNKLGDFSFCVERGKVSRAMAKECDLKFTVARRPMRTANKGLFSVPKRIAQRLLDLVPAAILFKFRLVPNRSIDALIDASGYAYGDRWGISRMSASAYENAYFRRASKPVIYLPQSFGPFEDPGIADAFRKMMSAADKIFVRDRLSYQFVSGALAKGDFEWAPDFTFDVPGYCPRDIPLPERYVCIIPNHRMVDISEGRRGEDYLRFLATCVEAARLEGVEAVIVNHDVKYDTEISKMLAARLGGNVRVVVHDDVRALKGIIGQSALTVSSRFHGLINALFQGVPVIATQWTHKFSEIMKNYGCEEYLLEPTAPAGVVKHSVTVLLNGKAREEAIRRITAARDRERCASERMWSEVRALLKAVA